VKPSILYPPEVPPAEASGPPACFPDLNLDQVVEAITAPRAAYELKPFFWAPLRHVEAVRYRQEVMRDLERPDLLTYVEAFAEEMRRVHTTLSMAEQLDSVYHRKGWFLEAALRYAQAVVRLADRLAGATLASRGLRAFQEYLAEYVQSPAFRTFSEEAREVKQGLSEVEYALILEPGRFRVRRYGGEADYSVEVEKVFAKFKQQEAEEYRWRFPERSGTSHIHAKILEFVAALYPRPFAALDRFCERYPSFIDPTVRTFEREVQFYLAYLAFIAPLKEAGLPFCYPEVSTESKEERVEEAFDLALAHALLQKGRLPVTNGFALSGPERVLVVTGPNQGGKTTFARMVGQLHYLASLGCPVPGKEARLFLPDRIFTHFQRSEDPAGLRSRLEDDLIRIRDALAQATPDSLFILNEIFSSTTLQDALFLSREIMTRLWALDVLAVWVTFLDELASLGEHNVSLVAEVDPQDPTLRTFRIVRKPADGLAYALSLARKYGLTPEAIRERLGRAASPLGEHRDASPSGEHKEEPLP